MSELALGDPPPPGWLTPHVMDGWGVRPLRWLSVQVCFLTSGLFLGCFAPFSAHKYTILDQVNKSLFWLRVSCRRMIRSWFLQFILGPLSRETSLSAAARHSVENRKTATNEQHAFCVILHAEFETNKNIILIRKKHTKLEKKEVSTRQKWPAWFEIWTVWRNNNNKKNWFDFSVDHCTILIEVKWKKQAQTREKNYIRVFHALRCISFASGICDHYSCLPSFSQCTLSLRSSRGNLPSRVLPPAHPRRLAPLLCHRTQTSSHSPCKGACKSAAYVLWSNLEHKSVKEQIKPWVIFIHKLLNKVAYQRRGRAAIYAWVGLVVWGRGFCLRHDKDNNHDNVTTRWLAGRSVFCRAANKHNLSNQNMQNKNR